MSFDSRTFRDALGRFVTGVTIITTRTCEGVAVGVTANSFNSVSMDPPLVLWSLGRRSRNLTAFENASHFCVHVLAAGQAPLSRQFSTSGIDKFAGLETDEGAGGVPLLAGTAARFECETFARYDGGDHVIFLGRVLDLTVDTSALPLVFHAGDYSALAVSDRD